MTYFIISSCAFACYLSYKAGHSQGKGEGIQIGFRFGKEYQQHLTDTGKPTAFEFKHYQTN